MKKNIIKRFFEPALYSKKLLYRSLFFAIRVGLYGIFNVYIFELITHHIESGKTEPFISSVIVYCAVTLTYFVGKYFMRFWQRVDLYRTDVKNMHRIYMKDFFTLDHNEVEKVGTGQRISIIENGFHARTDLIIHGIHVGTRVIITLIYASYIFISTHSIVFVGFLILFLGLHRLAIYLNNYALVYRKERIEIQHSYNAQLVKMIMSKFEISQSNKSSREIAILDTYADDCTIRNQRENNYLFFITHIPIVCIYTIKIAVYIYLGLQTIQGQAQISQLVGIVVLIELLEAVLGDSIKYYKELTFNFATVEKLWEHFDSIKPMKGFFKGEKFVHKKGAISFENVSFGYEEKELILNDLSLDIQGGKKTALVGMSGAGKTTLIKLIAGYIHPSSGSVLIDGQDIESVSLQSYYQHIGYLTQEPSVFDGTIKENLLYAIPEEELKDKEEREKKMKEAIADAQCDFIRDLANGLDTAIGERGIRLSGGQRQRLAIAKIFLKNPKIVFLDEPTSALDSFSEEAVTKAMNKLFEGRTVIIIAHRLQTTMNADDIIVMEAGKVIERGAHQQLTQKEGIYAKMLKLQAGF